MSSPPLWPGFCFFLLIHRHYGLVLVAFSCFRRQPPQPNELVTCEIMAALYCWRVRPPHSSLTMTVPSHSPPFSFVRSLGGMCGAVVTSPVVKTQQQSDLFRQKHAGVGAVVGDSVVLVRRPGGFLWHFVETAHIIRLRPPFFPLLARPFAPFSHTAHYFFGEFCFDNLEISREKSRPARYSRVLCPHPSASSPRAR